MEVKIVINEKGTSNDKSPKGNSWKEYWEEKTGKDFPKKCCVAYCDNNAEDGAHVINFYDNSNNYNKSYIIPLCKMHNNYRNEEPMFVKEDFLVELKK